MNTRPASDFSRSPVDSAGLGKFWRQHKHLLLCLLLAAIVVGTFIPAIFNDFVGYDDPDYVTANGVVQQGLTWTGIQWAFTSTAAANWHPLAWLSHMADVQLFGMRPWGHHLTSILLHALNTTLLFLVLFRLTGATWRSLIVAALFGLHPLRVESVAWISERKDVLSTTFGLLTLWAYARHLQAANERSVFSDTGPGIETRTQGAERRDQRFAPGDLPPAFGGPRFTFHASPWCILALVCFAFSLISKPMLVSLPFILLLLDYWPLGRWPKESISRLGMEKAPFFLAAVAVSGITFTVQQHGGAMATAMPFTARAENAAVAYWRYIGKLFWPADLAVFYPPVSRWPVAIVALACVLLIGATLLAWLGRRQRPYLLTGWLWFVGALVPVIGLVQVGEQSMADRYSYFPSVGLLLLVVWVVDQLTPSGLGHTILLPGAVLVVAVLCLTTHAQIGHWKSTETLFRHALAVTSQNYLAHYNLGTALEKQGRLDEALAQLTEAIKVKPDYAPAYNNSGIVLTRQGRFTEAIAQFEQASRLRPDYADPHNNLGLVLNELGRFEEATKQYQEAIRLKPGYADAHYNLGIFFGRQGQVDKAIEEFSAALRLQPNSADIHNNLGVALDRAGRLDEAIRHYVAALKLNPQYATAHFNLGVALTRAGQLDAAIEEFRAALRLKPDYTPAQKNLTTLLEMKKH